VVLLTALVASSFLAPNFVITAIFVCTLYHVTL